MKSRPLLTFNLMEPTTRRCQTLSDEILKSEKAQMRDTAEF